MNASVTNGTQGAAQVGSLTLNNTMANWSIPEQFLSQAIQSVKSFLSDAKKESYTVEVFMFNTPSGGALSTLLVAIKEIDKPIDSYSTVTVEYVTINTNAGLKPVYRISNRCFTCSDCFWFWECCCKNDEHVEQRSNTPEELNIIKQKMTADQFTWFNQKIVPST
jgi:hypothetical protein